MKKISLILALAFSIVFAGCEKDNTNNLKGCFKVKILNEICGTAVMQILDHRYYALGTNGYIQDGVTYDNVFSTDLSCADLAKYQTLVASLKGLETNVQLVKEIAEPNCAKCAAVVPNAPKNWIHVTLTNECPNN